MYCFVLMFRCMLMFYGRFKDRNKTGMRLVFLGWRLGRRPFKYGGCPVLPGGGLGGESCPLASLSYPAAIRNHFISKLSSRVHSF